MNGASRVVVRSDNSGISTVFFFSISHFLSCLSVGYVAGRKSRFLYVEHRRNGGRVAASVAISSDRPSSQLV